MVMDACRNRGTPSSFLVLYKSGCISVRLQITWAVKSRSLLWPSLCCHRHRDYPNCKGGSALERDQSESLLVERLSASGLAGDGSVMKISKNVVQLRGFTLPRIM